MFYNKTKQTKKKITTRILKSRQNSGVLSRKGEEFRIEWLSGTEISFLFAFRNWYHKLKDVLMEDLIRGGVLPFREALSYMVGQDSASWNPWLWDPQHKNERTVNRGVTFGVEWGAFHIHVNFNLFGKQDAFPGGGSVFEIFFLSPRVSSQRRKSVFPRMEILEKRSNS